MDALETRTGVPRKRLARWIHHGIARTRETKGDLEKVCVELGLESKELWEPEPEDVATDWGELLTKTLTTLETWVPRKDGTWANWLGDGLVRDLLSDVRRRFNIASAAAKLASERPDLVPQELSYLPPFAAFWQLADRLNTMEPEPLFERLRGILLARAALADQTFSITLEQVTQVCRPSAHAPVKYPHALVTVQKPGFLPRFVEVVNDTGSRLGKTRGERESFFWSMMGELNLPPDPEVVARRFPHVASYAKPEVLAKVLEDVMRSSPDDPIQQANHFWKYWRQREKKAEELQQEVLRRYPGIADQVTPDGVAEMWRRAEDLNPNDAEKQETTFWLGWEEFNREAVSESPPTQQAKQPEEGLPPTSPSVEKPPAVSYGLAGKLRHLKSKKAAQTPGAPQQKSAEDSPTVPPDKEGNG